jgi:competence protein ComEC
VRERLAAALDGARYEGVIVALAVGDQNAIPPAHWTVFTRTGVNHLMSISGLHLTMIAGLLFAIVNAVWRRVPGLAARLASHRAAALAGLMAAAAYGLLSGFAVPAQRTVLMLAVVAAALWSGWRWPTATVLAVALGAVVVFDPMAASSPGFWLSFGAVAALLLAAAGRLQRPRMLASWLHSQWAVTVALTPLLIALFQQVSVVSPVANAVAIPVISLVVVPIALLAIVVPLDVLAQLAHAVLAPCMALLVWLAQAPGAAWQQHAPAPWAVAAAVAGAVWLMLPRGFPARWLGACAMLPLFLARPPGPAAQELWVTALDVGQGLAVVVRTPGHALLFDTGPSYLGGSDAGERIIVPFLRGEGISRLDAMIVSHDDSDHAGGALSVLSAVPVARLLTSLPDRHPVRLAARASSRCVREQRWQWDGLEFEVLHPAAESYNRAPVKDNDRSCVLRIAGNNGVVLITGDIEQASERELLLNLAGRLPSRLLIAPHHGSRTSSSPAFVRTVGAEHVLFSNGHRNRFGHPHPLVTARYRAAGAQALRTDASGAVTFRFNLQGVSVQQWRLSEPRFWHGL